MQGGVQEFGWPWEWMPRWVSVPRCGCSWIWVPVRVGTPGLGSHKGQYPQVCSLMDLCASDLVSHKGECPQVCLFRNLGASEGGYPWVWLPTRGRVGAHGLSIPRNGSPFICAPTSRRISRDGFGCE